MAQRLASAVTERLGIIDGLAVKAGEEVSEELLNWRPAGGTPTIAFHLWHIARYSDRNAALLPQMSAALADKGSTQELWASGDLAGAWGLDTGRLGPVSTGMGMSDSDAGEFRPPSRGALLDYLRQSTAALERVCAAIDDQIAEQVSQRSEDNGTTVGFALLSHLSHVSRHLGMIEALRGAHGERGSATA